MGVKESVQPSARERLLASANELFYAEGVQTVGIDRIIEHAGVAKASLYNIFGSKEELVRAYLETRQAGTTGRIVQAVERQDTPRGRLLAIFEAQAEIFAKPDFHGCAFVSATAEARPGSAAEKVTADYRAWIRALLTDLAVQAGVAEPATLAWQLHLLYDGAALSARMDHSPSVSAVAMQTASALVDAALAQSSSD
jgi:AcrR family transcriptional regulator